MPPKKPAQASAGSKKTQEKKKEKIIEVRHRGCMEHRDRSVAMLRPRPSQRRSVPAAVILWTGLVNVWETNAFQCPTNANRMVEFN